MSSNRCMKDGHSMVKGADLSSGVPNSEFEFLLLLRHVIHLDFEIHPWYKKALSEPYFA